MNIGRWTIGRRAAQRKAEGAESLESPVQNRRRNVVGEITGDEETKKSKAETIEIPRKKRRTSNIGPLIRDLLSGEFLTQEGVTRNIPYLGFVSFLFLIYIGIGYRFERIEREKLNARRKIEELNAEFKTLQADFEIRRHQSRLEADMADRGLMQPKSPPHLLQVTSADWKELNAEM
jgi:hypothetical protein